MTVQLSLAPIRRRLDRLDRDTLLEWAARFGHAARATVYLAIGGFALSAVLNGPAEAEGTTGALEQLADWPLGGVWLFLIAAGLCGFSAWRFVQALFNAERHPHSLTGWGARAGEAVSGVVYGLLGWTAMSLMDGLEDFREPDEDARETAAAILSLPFGQALLVAAGLLVASVGVSHLWRALTTDFCARLSCRGTVASRIQVLGRLGYAARAAGFLLIGFYVLQAAWTLDSGKVESLEGVLEGLVGGRGGDWAAIAVGLGFLAFGLFGLAEARYRRILIPEALSSD